MLENLINDLLDLGKLENNAFALNPEYFNLSQTIYEAFEILLFSANQANVQLSA
jgi:signal transduction histidine kinase